MASNDRQSRRELLETIEQQKEQITRYENRLRDVVHAYKGLVKQKEALENSLTILNNSNTETKEETSGGEISEDSSEARYVNSSRSTYSI